MIHTNNRIKSIFEVKEPKVTSKRNLCLICIGLIVLILSLYMQVEDHQFINLDDDVYVTNNAHVLNGITCDNFFWAFSIENSAGFWHPITWLSHMLDVQFYGLNPRGHHITNVIIHTLSSLLLLIFLFRSTGSLWKSSFVAVMFAIHPLHVESVAWVAERKDVLSAFFGFITLIFYSEYAFKKDFKLYLASLLFFVFGLMSKPMIVTLPIVMLLMDYWPLNRYCYVEPKQNEHNLLIKVYSFIKEKIPFFVCSLFAGVLTIYTQHNAGAMVGANSLRFSFRIKNAIIAYVKYIDKTLWPHDLAVFYPLQLSFPNWLFSGSLFLLLLSTVTIIYFRKRCPYLVLGWFWFLVVLLPVIGLLQSGTQSMADRFSYIPMVGILIMAAWGVPELTKGLKHQHVINLILASAAIIASSAMTWHQLGYWRNNISLYEHTLQVTANNGMIIHNLAVAHIDLGIAFAQKGNIDTAILEFKEAIRIEPGSSEAYCNLGNALAINGNVVQAIREYQKALEINPNNTKAYSNLEHAVSLKKQGEQLK